jgi:hypothetical protein
MDINVSDGKLYSNSFNNSSGFLYFMVKFWFRYALLEVIFLAAVKPCKE